MVLRKPFGLSSPGVAEELTGFLDYIVEDHRYNIVQYIGCQLAIFIVCFPPLLLSLGTFVHAGMCSRHPFVTSTSNIPLGIALYHFVQMRIVFSSVLQVSSSPMSTNRYMHLTVMSAILVLWNTVLTSLAIWENTFRGLRPWVNWERVHSNWIHDDAYVWILMTAQSRILTLSFW